MLIITITLKKVILLKALLMTYHSGYYDYSITQLWPAHDKEGGEKQSRQTNQFGNRLPCRERDHKG